MDARKSRFAQTHLIRHAPKTQVQHSSLLFRTFPWERWLI